MRFIILSLALLVSLTSCERRAETEPTNFSNVFGIDDYERAEQELNVYARYGVYTDGVSKLFLQKPDGLGDQAFGQIFAKYRAEPTESRSDGGIYYINEFPSIFASESDYQPELGIPNHTPEMGQLIEGEFGKETRFRLIRRGKPVYDHTMYIPRKMELIDFTNSGKVESTIFSKISRNDFSFTWEGDENNENGVLVLLAWSHDMLEASLGELGGSDYHYKAVWVVDNGIGEAPSSLFDDVPAGATFKLYFMRANIEIITGTDERSYKVYGLTQDEKACVLID